MAGLKKRSRTYYIEFSRTINGKQSKRKFSLGTRNKIHAERLRGKFTELENTGRIDPFRDDFVLPIDDFDNSIKLNKALDIFLENHLHWANSTHTAYKTILACFIKRNGFENKFLTQITSNDISRYLMRDDISNATRKKEYRHMKHFWRWCLDKHWIKKSPLKGVVLPREVPNTTAKMIRYDELMTLFKAFDEYHKGLLSSKNYRSWQSQDWFKPLIVTYFYTGCRRQELLNVIWDDVTEDLRFIRINDKKDGDERIVYIRKPLIPYWEEYAKKHKRNPEDPVFYNLKTGLPLTGDHVYRAFKTYLKKAGLPKSRTVHGLRHAFATNSLNDRVPLEVAQKSLGHSSPVVTQMYQHISKVDLKEWYDKVNKEEKDKQ